MRHCPFRTNNREKGRRGIVMVVVNGKDITFPLLE
jgi:hypothetical protein